MTRETIFDRALKIVEGQKDYKRIIALSAGVDTRDVDKLIEENNKDIINAVLLMSGLGGRIRTVETSAKKFIEKTIQIAAWDQRFYTIWGPTGIGKTVVSSSSVESLRQVNDEPIGIVRVTEFNKSNLRYFLRDLSHGFGLGAEWLTGTDDKESRWRGYITYSTLKERFKDRHGVIVIDEAHRLKDKVFNGIRDLMDSTRLSVVMLGATELTRLLDKQFIGRLDDKYELPEASAKDAQIFLLAYGVEVDIADARIIARKISKLRSYGTLKNAMRIISKSVKEGEFTWKNIGGGQVIDAISRVMATMRVTDDSSASDEVKK